MVVGFSPAMVANSCSVCDIVDYGTIHKIIWLIVFLLMRPAVLSHSTQRGF